MSSGAARNGHPDVTVVVVTFRGAQWVSECLSSLAAQTLPHRLLVIDNASSDGTGELLRDLLPPGQVLRLPVNAGFAGGVAAALPLVTTRFVALLNDDAIAAPGWLAELTAAAVDDPDAAAWTSLMLLADDPGRVNNLGGALDSRWYGTDVAAGAAPADIDGRITDSFAFSGGAALLRTAAIRAVGGFPADYFMYYEDLDTSWRLQLAGWAIRAVPSATVRHRHAASSDRRSEMFHFHNERNRLLTLLRCAPLPTALGQLLRFVLTTGSLAATRLAGRGVPDHANFRIGLRVRVLASALRRVPRVLGARPGTAATRRAVARRARTVP
ncbi:glycosyltransferase family 2 protein [Nakamurella sp. GG22]